MFPSDERDRTRKKEIVVINRYTNQVLDKTDKVDFERRADGATIRQVRPRTLCKSIYDHLFEYLAVIS